MSHNFRVPLSSTVRCHKLHTGAHGSLGFRVFHGQHGLLQSLNVLGPNKTYMCRIRNLARRPTHASAAQRVASICSKQIRQPSCCLAHISSHDNRINQYWSEKD